MTQPKFRTPRGPSSIRRKIQIAALNGSPTFKKGSSTSRSAGIRGGGGGGGSNLISHSHLKLDIFYYPVVGFENERRNAFPDERKCACSCSLLSNVLLIFSLILPFTGARQQQPQNNNSSDPPKARLRRFYSAPIKRLMSSEKDMDSLRYYRFTWIVIVIPRLRGLILLVVNANGGRHFFSGDLMNSEMTDTMAHYGLF